MKSHRLITYPAIADSVDLPDFIFHKSSDGDAFILLTGAEQKLLFEQKKATNRAMELDNRRLMTLLSPISAKFTNSDVTLHIISERGAVLKIKQFRTGIVIQAHWNLFQPYFYQIKNLSIAHSEILDVFARAVFNYAALAMKHDGMEKSEFRNVVIDAYILQPELLLASLDILNKPNIYHIHSTRIWLTKISEANDKHRLQIDVSAAAANPLVSLGFLKEVAVFIHKVAKNYAFRYVDYLWTQQYSITCDTRPELNMVTREGNVISINIYPLLNKTNWKPMLYLSLGYAIMLALLEASGGEDEKINVYLSMMKTWNRYLSFDESMEQQCVREICRLPSSSEVESRVLLKCMTCGENMELIDEFIRLIDYSAQETIEDKLKLLKEARSGNETGAQYEQLWDRVRNLNAGLVKNNINYSKFIEVLRNDNIDYIQLADLLRTGRLENRCVVDVSEWLLLRTLLYDLISSTKVFSNDYKMLLKVLTKVNKSLIVYVWTLVFDNDMRHERVNTYIARLLNDIFVFNRVKIYEIVSDPAECLETEAVTGYLLNWAGLSQDELRSIRNKVPFNLPRNIVPCLNIRTAGDVDHLVRVMTIRSSGIIGFCLHKVYQWGSMQDELTGKIRSHFPELLQKAQDAMHPRKIIMGGAMLLLVLAQTISDQRDGFAQNVAIKEEDRQIVLNLIKQCIDWDQRHYIMMVGGIAAGYLGIIDGWILRQFDILLGRYGGGDRVVLRSVVQFDVENLIERTLITAKEGKESELLKKIQLLRLGVDPVISDQVNKFFGTLACRYGISAAEVALKKKDIGELILELSRRMKA